MLDYLCHSCYTNTARAFNRESTVRHLDADGDEIIIEHIRPGVVQDVPVGAAERVRRDPEERFEAHMKQVELRQREPSVYCHSYTLLCFKQCTV